MDKYMQILKQAQKHLTACKACNTCKNVTEKIDRDLLQVTCYCNVYQKDVTRHVELMCNCYAEK